MPTITIPTWNFQQVQAQKASVKSILLLQGPPVVTPDDLQEAEIIWGGPSQFEFSTTDPPQSSGGGVSVKKPGSDAENIAPLTMVWTEVARQTEDVVITADGNPEVSVTVRRIQQIDFQAPPEFLTLMQRATGVAYDSIVARYVLTGWEENA